MRRSIAWLMVTALLTGCGTYRITYRLPSRQVMAETTPIKRSHAHGIGLIGGGGWFFIVSQIFPAWIDYTGPVSIPENCPAGVYEVSHHHGFGWNALAAFISWVIVVNAYHRSEVNLLCVKPQPSTAPETPEAP